MLMKNRRNFKISYLLCPDCSHQFPIPRKNRDQRENNHIKDLYCPFCKKKQKMKEIKHNQAIKNMAGEFLSIEFTCQN